MSRDTGGLLDVIGAVITIGLPPIFHVGPVPVAWHGLMIAVGIIAGGWLALRYGRSRGLDPERIQVAILVLALSGGLGARFYYLAQTDAGSLIRPGDWFGSVGYAFYGAILVGVPAVALYLRRTAQPLVYLDALAAGFPLGMAVGRVGDLINGEHYGPVTTAPWGFRYTNPDAAVPSTDLAFQSGAFYEVLLALGMLALLWPAARRISTPGILICATVGLYAAGRFLIFFVIRDSSVVAFGLRQAQLTSLALIGLSALGVWWLGRGTAKTPENPRIRDQPPRETI